MLAIESILVADDHELIVRGICNILKEKFLVGEISVFTSAVDILDDAKKNRYELYILDLEFEDISGFELIKILREQNSEAKIIVVTMHDELWNIQRLISLNVNGIVLKKSSNEYLPKAVTAVMSGKQFYCPKFEKIKTRSLAYRKIKKNKLNEPSKTELQVLKYIAEGYTSKQIAEVMFVSEDTIEAHRKNLFLKTGAKNVAHLVSIAIHQHLID